MKIKVCGMRQVENIHQIAALDIDFMGFIFYPKSPRFVTMNEFVLMANNIQRVGVFVNANLDKVLEKVDKFQLHYVQLHGNESPSYCQKIQQKGISVIKAFPVGKDFNFGLLNEYENACEYFLLDAKGDSYGGNGIRFDWQLLKKYPSNKPFFLSGGIDLESIPDIQQLNIPQLYALDINSKFEIEPALKDVPKVKTLVQAFKTIKN